MNKDSKEKQEEEVGLDPEVCLDSDDIMVDEEEGDYLKIVKKLREKLKACEIEKQKNLEGWQRSRADYVNAKKDEDKRILELEPFIKEKVFLEIIPIADNFDMAFSNKEAWEKIDKNWRVGIEGIYSNLLNTFSSLGLEQIGKAGDKFNTEEYQAIESVDVESKEEDDIVVNIVQKGYRYKNKVIRPSKVKVGVYKE